MHPNVHTNAIGNSQDMEAILCPSTHEWIKKICTQTDIYAHDGILVSHKKRNSAIIKSVDGPRGYYAQ